MLKINNRTIPTIIGITNSIPNFTRICPSKGLEAKVLYISTDKRFMEIIRN